MGTANEKTERFGHTDMPVFGAGKDIAPRIWQSIFRQLLAMGLISVDHSAYGALKLEPEARAVFRHEREVLFRKDRPQAGRKAMAGGSPAARERDNLSGSDRELSSCCGPSALPSPRISTCRPMSSSRIRR